MSVSYKKLWIHLIEKNMKRTDLIKLTGITSNTLANMGKDEYIYEKLRKNMESNESYSKRYLGICGGLAHER